MKSSKELEEILLQRKRSLFALKNKVADEDPYLRGKQLGIFFRALKGIEKQHNGIDKKITELETENKLLKEQNTLFEQRILALEEKQKVKSDKKKK